MPKLSGIVLRHLRFRIHKQFVKPNYYDLKKYELVTADRSITNEQKTI